MMRVVLSLLAFVLQSAVPPSSGLVYHGGTSHQVALTFDAGSDRGFAPSILGTLERFHLHATFGMTGRWARANRDLVLRMARDGDAFINHTYDHRSFTGFSSRTVALTQSQRVWEITQADRVIRSITGRSTKPYFRPPYGDLDPAMLTLARKLGYGRIIMWSVDSLGWERLPAPAILQRCLSLVQPGGIVLMHVGSQSQDGVALPALLTALKHRDYKIVTVPQLLAR
jgi:peptidoglycan/xylan/chitin deacetylase (PgdA/CDA1 family)